MGKRYYWLKLQRDFFKRHDIRIVESMPNGKDYILFYLKLLVESIDHEGELRFSETIPYNEEMLATITNTNVDVVRNAMKLFSELGMVDMLEDSTIFMTEVNRMIGSETDDHIREQNRLRQQRYRDKQKLLNEPEALHNVTVTLNRNVEKEIDKDKEKEIDINSLKDDEFRKCLDSTPLYYAKDGSEWPNQKLADMRNKIIDRGQVSPNSLKGEVEQ